MPRSVDSLTRDNQTSPDLGDLKKDIDVGKSGTLDGGGRGTIVKLPPSQVFRPNLFKPAVPDAELRLSDLKTEDPPVVLKATLRPQKPRTRKFIDGKNRDILPKDINFQLPPRPAAHAHHGKITAGTAFFTGGGTGAVTAAVMIGASIGGSAGSVVPIVGTAVGVVVGTVAGIVIGHLVKKYRRSHTEHRYFQNARKSLEKQGVKFTKAEEKRLDSLSPAQWAYLMKDNGPTIKALKKYSFSMFGNRRWAKQFYYQFAIMAVAKRGFKRAQLSVAQVQHLTKTQKNPHTVVPGTMLSEMALWGADTLHIQSIAEGKDLQDLRSLETKKWENLTKNVEKEFGGAGLAHFKKRYARFYDRATRADFVAENVDNAREMRRDLTNHLQPYLQHYDQDIQKRIGLLVEGYALDVAVGDVPHTEFYDLHGNFDREFVEELINTAASLQAAKERFKSTPVDRVRSEILIRQATLPNRISGYTTATGRRSMEVYERFIGDAPNIYDECEQLLKIKERDLGRMLGQASTEPDTPPKVDVLATCQAMNLRSVAELGVRLRDKGIEQSTARMILRMAAQDRAASEADFYRQNSDPDTGDYRYSTKDVGGISISPGWPATLSDDASADLPKKEMLDRASVLAADASRLHTALQQDPDLRHLTETDAENIYFGFAAQHVHTAYDDNGLLDEMRQNDFAVVKEILKAGVRGNLVYRALHRGAESLDEAIECARLLVDAWDMRNVVSNMSETELKAWKDQKFSDVEIAAYRNNLVDWRVDTNSSPARIISAGHLDIEIDNEKMAGFQGSGLPADEANDLLLLNLAPKANLPALKPRHLDATTYVLSDDPGGMGATSHTRIRTIRGKDGTIDRRVFKQVPIDDQYNLNLLTRRQIGSNLAASMVDKELGFGVIVDTQLSTRNGMIGLSMELAKGHQPFKLQTGEVFVPVPENEPQYAELHKRVRDDMTILGAISDETRDYAARELKLTRLRVTGSGLQAAGDFLTDLIEDPGAQEGLVDVQINDFLNREDDRHLNNVIIDIRLGPKGATAVAVKGIDNDGGFASGPSFSTSVRTMPRVISRRQADAIKSMYKTRWNEPDGILAKLNQVVVPSDLEQPVGPDASFPFETAYAATDASLPPAEGGDQVLQFAERLKLLYDRVTDAEDGKSKDESDGFPTLTIISGTAPKNDEKGDIGDNVKLDIDTRNDMNAAWGSKQVTKILTNTSSIVERLKRRRG